VLRFLADEDFDNNILHGCHLRIPHLDLLRVQDADLEGADDPTILEWAATERRVLLSHDASTMPGHAYDRIGQDLPMPGVFIVGQSLPIGQAIEEIVVLAQCSREGEWEGRVLHLPL
jgi:hypothetical protein